MAIVCPICGGSIQLKEPKPGRYQPKCPKCGARFKLTISDDPAAAPIVEQTQAPPSSVEETAGAEGAVSASATAKPAPPSSARRHDPEATADFSQPARGPAGRAPEDDETAATAPAPSAASANDASSGFDLSPDVGVSKLDDVPATLGGYQIVKELGRGGMGAVYLARQISLDRNVAVKVMRPEWAKDPIFVARFTREAYAAAQLNHHHVVQIHDIGEERATNYFSMEFVDGQSLADLVRREGKLDVEVAVGYVLQAARGLAFAHEQGMVHRDIKPDNLLLSRHGIVKVADLGIVKTPSALEKAATNASLPPGARVDASAPTKVTLAGTAMGTPAYMAPEQARDASHVDGRADIYSLGCTLYVLVTGRTPFEGRTAAEVITKHATEAVLPPDMVVKRVPKGLSEIIVKMVAKAPEDRYQSMTEVAKALERFLGVESSGPFSPREEHAQTLEQAVGEFNGCAAAKLRSKALLGGAAILAVATLIAIFVSPAWAGACLGLGVLTAAAYFVIGGVVQKTYLFRQARQLVLGGSWSDLAMLAIAGVLFLVVLYLFGLLWIWLGVLVAAMGIAATLGLGLDRKIAAARREPLERVEQMLKSMRLHGLEEDSLRHFVCKYSGQRWEEFYEALFGYEAMLAARERWGQGERGHGRPRFGAWRDPIVRWIDARQEARRQLKERKHLQQVEEKGFKAAGLDATQARLKAEQAAAALVTKAAKTRKVPVQLAKPESSSGGLSRLADLFGGKTRFAAGALLLAGSLLWMHQNEMIPGQAKLQDIKQMATEAIESQDLKKLADVEKLQANLENLKQEVNLADLKAAAVKQRKPLSLPLVPAWASKPLGTFCAALAGLLMIGSALIGGRKAAVVALLAIGIFAAQWAGLP